MADSSFALRLAITGLPEISDAVDKVTTEVSAKFAEMAERVAGSAAAFDVLVAAADRDNAAYDKLAANAQRYRESLDGSIALERERVTVLAQLDAKIVDSAEAYERLTAAALKAAGAGASAIAGSVPVEVHQFAAVGGTGALGSASDAVAALQAQKAALAATAEAQLEQERAGSGLKAQYDAETRSLENLVQQYSPLLRVKQLEADLNLAVSRGLTDVAEKERILAAETQRATEQVNQQNRLAAGSHGGGGSLGFALGDVFNQIQDVVVQVQGGTNVFRSLSQQLPQMAGALVFFGGAWVALGPIIGTVAGIAAAAVGTFLQLGNSQESLAQQAEKAGGATDKLLQSLGVSAKSADEFKAGLEGLTAAQKDLVQVDLAAQLDAQIAAMQAASQQAKSLEGATLGAAVRTTMPGADVAGVPGLGLTIPQEGNQDALDHAAAVRALSEAYDEGRGSLKEYRDEIQQELVALGEAGDRATAEANKQALAKAAVTEHDHAIELIIARINAANGVWDEWTVKTLNQADAMAAATRAAKSFGDGMTALQAIIDRPIANPRQQFVEQALKQNSLDPASIAKMSDEAQRTAQDLATRMAQKADQAFTVRADAQVDEKNKAAAQQYAETLKELAGSYDKVRVAGDTAASAKERELGVDEAARPAGQRAIELARQQAEATARLSDQRTAAAQAESRRQAGAKMADEDQARADDFVQKSQDGLVASEQALAAARQGGLDQTKEAIATRQAEQEVIQSGIVFTDAEREAQVRLIAQRILNVQAAKDELAVNQQLQKYRDQAANLGRSPFAGAAGQPLGADDLANMSSAALKTAQDRAKAISDAISQMPAADRQDQEKVNEIVKARLTLFDAEYAARVKIASVDLAAKANEDLKSSLALIDALQKGVQAYDELKERQDITGQLQGQGLTAGTPEFDQAFWDEWAARAVKAHGTAARDSAEAWNKGIGDTIAKPFEQIPDVLDKALGGVLDQARTTGRVSGAQFATSLAQGIQGIGANFLGNAFQEPFRLAGQELSAELQKALAGDGNPFKNIFDGLNTFGNKSALNAGLLGLGIGSTVGAIGGTIGTVVTGNPNTGLGASLGGVVGGGAGALVGAYFGMPLVGAAVGSVAGTAVGGFAGSLFGGDSAPKDRANFSYFPGPYIDPTLYDQNPQWEKNRGVRGSGIVYEDQSSSAQNRERLAQVVESFNGVADVLSAAGVNLVNTIDKSFTLSAENNKGIQLDGKRYDSADQVVRAFIQSLLQGSRADNVALGGQLTDTQITVLRNTNAKSAQELQSDIAFGASYDQLTHKTGAYGQALFVLDQQYNEAIARASRLGLDTGALRDELARQQGYLADQAKLSIQTLEGVAGPFAAAMFDLDKKFRDASESARDLGMDEATLAAARTKAVADLRTQYTQQLNQLTGNTSNYQNDLFQVRQNFQQAAALQRDLGTNLNLPQLQAKAEADLRQKYIDQIGQLTNTTTGFEASVLQLRDRFKQAEDIMKEMGYTSAQIAATQAQERQAELQLAQDSLDQLRQQYQGQAQQLRQFFAGLIDPLKQALSASGQLAGVYTPQANLQAQLAAFRKDYGAAANDNVDAIQRLPQEAQQLLQLAQQYGGTGRDFTAIYREVQTDLAQVLSRTQGEQTAALANIPDVIANTTIEQTRQLVDAIGKVQQQILQLQAAMRLITNPQGRVIAG